MTWKKGDDGKYVRTVRCSYCYEVGHNKSSCPALKKYIDKLREENGDHAYSVADYDRMKKKRSNRSCGYCRNQDHNVRSCEKMNADIDNEFNLNKIYRAEMLEHMRNSGVGVGALIKINNFMDKDYQRTEVLGFIEEIRWDNIRSCGGYGYSSFPQALVVAVQKEDYYGNCKQVLNVPFHPGIGGENYSYNYERYEVINPSENINPPSGWFEMEDIENVDNLFRQILREEGSYHVNVRHQTFFERLEGKKE